MGKHAERDHALLSASSAHRWLACTKSARLEELFPDTTSDAAKEGTLAHELAELKIRHYFCTPDFGKTKFTRAVNKLKKEPLWDNEMERHTEEYLDFVRTAAMEFKGIPHVAIEKRLDLSAYVPEGFGTADCILIGGGTIHVIDFKYGQGVSVSPEQNPQMMLYALGAYELYRLLYPIQRIILSIVQPRIQEGGTSWELSLEDLLVFSETIRARADLAYKGEGEFAPGEKTCRFCRAKKQCRAWSDYNVKHAFQMGDLPPLITNEEAGRRLLELESVVKYQKDLQDWALSECLAGKDVPGWKAVEGRSSRDWTDMEKAFQTLMENQIPKALLYEERPLTLAQVEKVVGKKEFAQIAGDYVIHNPGKPTLVKKSDKRQAITNKITAAEAFKED